MNANAARADPDLITKGEFARRRKVTPGRVSQWISEKKLSGDAIVGTGRAALIRESVACAQLKQKLDPLQLAGNGLATRLELAPAVAADAQRNAADPPAAPDQAQAPPPATPSGADAIEDRIKQGRAEAIERANRIAAANEAAQSGRLTDAADAANEMRRLAGQLLNVFEGSLPELATAIAAQWKLPQRDVLHLLRTEFAKVRSQTAATYRKTAETMPRLVGTDIDVAGAAAE